MTEQTSTAAAPEFEGYVKYADDTVISLQCFEERHHECPDEGVDGVGSHGVLDGYVCECDGCAHGPASERTAPTGPRGGIVPDGAPCPQCGSQFWEFTGPGRAECLAGHQWDQAPGIPGTFVRPGYPGDINDPERYQEDTDDPE